MKMIVEEKNAEGLESLLGETVTLFGFMYFYTGKLIGVNDTCVKLENPYIVYETGAFSEKGWKDAQKLPHKYFRFHPEDLPAYRQPECRLNGHGRTSPIDRSDAFESHRRH